MTARQYLHAYVRWWWLIAICVAIGILVPTLISVINPAPYRAVTYVVVTNTKAVPPSPSDLNAASVLAKERVDDYAAAADDGALANAMAQDGVSGMSVADLARHVDVSVPDNSAVIKIVVTADTPSKTLDLVTRAGTAMAGIVDRMEAAGSPVPTLLKGRVVPGPSPAVTHQGNAPWHNVLLCAAAGLLVGLSLAVTLSRLRPRLWDRDAVTEIVNAPVLGTLPAPYSGSTRSDSRARRYSLAVEQLRSSVYFLRDGRRRSISVAFVGLGRVDRLADVCHEVARSLASTGAHTLLLIAVGDSEAPMSPDEHDGQVGEGELSELVESGRDSTADTAYLHGPAASDDGLHSTWFATILQQASDRYDYILVCAPPIAERTGALAIAARCDATIIAVDRSSRARQLRTGIELLRTVDAHVRGSVLLR